MTTIYRSEAGQIVRAEDAYGTYYYTCDDFGQPGSGGYTSEDDARAAMAVAESGEDVQAYPEPDVRIDERGRRVGPCAHCGCDVPVTDLPDADDDAGWEELARDHDDDCEWVATRAHRR